MGIKKGNENRPPYRVCGICSFISLLQDERIHAPVLLYH